MVHVALCVTAAVAGAVDHTRLRVLAGMWQLVGVGDVFSELMAENRSPSCCGSGA